MLKKRTKRGWVMCFVFILLTACALSTDRRERGSESHPGEWNCPPLPQTFKESDLVGTWQSRHGSWATDTIILRQDGTYKQVYYSRPNDYYYESTWNEWWLEHRASGGLYLHLDDMRYCLSTDELCRAENPPDATTFHDVDTYVAHCRGLGHAATTINRRLAAVSVDTTAAHLRAMCAILPRAS